MQEKRRGKEEGNGTKWMDRTDETVLGLLLQKLVRLVHKTYR